VVGGAGGGGLLDAGFVRVPAGLEGEAGDEGHLGGGDGRGELVGRVGGVRQGFGDRGDRVVVVDGHGDVEGVDADGRSVGVVGERGGRKRRADERGEEGSRECAGKDGKTGTHGAFPRTTTTAAVQGI